MDSNKKLFYMLAILVIAVIISFSLYYIYTKEYKNWISTEGTIINIEETFGTRTRSYDLYYTYTVNGRNYEGYYSVRKLSGEPSVGEKIEVWYNPSAPSQSMYGKPNPRFLLYIPIIFSIPLSLCVFDYGHTRRRKLM